MAVSFDVKNIPVLKEDDVATLGQKEIEDRMSAAAKNSHELWVEFKTTDGKLSAEEAAAIKTLNDNMSVLRQRADALKETRRMGEELEKQHSDLFKPVRPDGLFGKSSSNTDSGGWNGKTIGDLFVESKAYSGYNPSTRSSPEQVEIDEAWNTIRKQRMFDTQFKTVLDTTGFAPQAVRTGLIVPGALRRPVVADLIPSGTTGQNAIVYMEETTTTNAAAATAEGGTKPESALAFTERTSNVRKIATVLPVTDELFQDAPAMRDYINARLEVFITLAEEAELVSGSGTSPHLTGMLNVAGIQTQAKGTDPTPDAVYKAMVLISTTAFLEADGAIFNPLDWQDVRLLRTADGVYIWGSPADPGPSRIWGVPVVPTTAMTQNTAIVAAFSTAMQIFRRSGIQFAVSTEHSDFFIKNQLMIRAEERLAFVVYRPEAICTVTGV